MQKIWILSLFSMLALNSQEQPKTVWEDFVYAKKNGTTPILPDFSYVGYKYSEVPIPDVDYKTFDVTEFGAVPNDTLSDKKCYQKSS